jgi:predicted amidohydrolase YtcJ
MPRRPWLRAAVGLLGCTIGPHLSAIGAQAQSADTILVNGKIVSGDVAAPVRSAIAIADGKILALGDDAEMRRFAGPRTQVVDLGGRTVIPGLIDSHIHGIRAALSFATEVSWIDAATLVEALDRIRAAAKAAKPGAWLIVAGGWTEEQFAERRRPTQADLAAAAPDNPVYVQLFYRWAMLTPLALRALNIASDADLPSGAKLERDADGNPTGGITGGIREFGAIFAKLPAPSDADQVAGTKRFFSEMNRLGVTGIVDAGGIGVTPESYQALFKVWRERELTLRVAYSLSAPAPGEDEMKAFQDLTRLAPAGFGDDMLRFTGIGEIVTWGLYNNDHPTEQQKQQFYEVARWAAGRGMQLRVHWPHDASVGQLLDIFERVDRDVKVAPLHWIVDHLDDASVASLARMKALGVGWAFQDAMYFAGDRYAKTAGLDAARRAPPLATGLHIGVIMGAGTDAHRVMSYNPFVALRWILDGRTVAGVPLRAAEETPTRLEALHLYTEGSAWFAKDEDRRGSLKPGKFADLAVLDRDYFSIPVAEIARLQSLLTMVGGKIVYAAGPFGGIEAK